MPVQGRPKKETSFFPQKSFFPLVQGRLKTEFVKEDGR
jgi:hypothetical protein